MPRVVYDADGTPHLEPDGGPDYVYQAQETPLDPRFPDPPYVGQTPPQQGKSNPTALGRDVRIVANPVGLANGAYEGILGQLTNAIWTPTEEESSDWVITIQLKGDGIGNALPSLTGAGPTLGHVAGYYLVQIQWMVGGANFKRTMLYAASGVAGAFRRRIPISARKVQIDVLWGWDQVGGPLSGNMATFSVACEKVETPSPLFAAPVWAVGATRTGVLRNAYVFTANPPDSPLGSYGVQLAPGMLVSMSGFLVAPVAAGAVPLYPMAFDQTNTIFVGGEIPIAGAIGPPITNAGDSFSLSDEEDPQIAFQKGLVIALSTDPTVYAAPGAGATFQVSAKFGQ